MTLSLFAFVLIAMSSCNKESSTVTFAEGDIFEFATIQNRGEIKGWKLENGATVALTSAEIKEITDQEDAFGDDLDNMGGSIEFKADNKAMLTDPDGFVETYDYEVNGKTLTVTVSEQGITVTFAFEVDGDNIIRKAYSDYSGSNGFSFSTSGAPWFQGAEDATKSSLTQEGQKVLYMYYEERFTKK